MVKTVFACCDDADDEEVDRNVEKLFIQLDSLNLSTYQESIIAYIAGFVVRKLRTKMSCAICVNALTQTRLTTQQLPTSHHSSLDLILSKDRGGLVFPSESVIHIIRTAEKAFRVAVAGCQPGTDKISSDRRLRLILSMGINRHLHAVSLFPTLHDHDVNDTDISMEDMHSTQLQKKIVAKYLSLRFRTYGKHYTKSVIQLNKEGVRQQHNKLVLFQNL